jgi:glycine oxidase
MNPLVVQALRAACALEGVLVHEHQEVRELRRAGDRVVGVRTTSGEFSCGRLIIAAGAWSSLVDPSLRDRIPVYPVRGQIILLEMQSRPFTHILERGKCYLVPRLNGRIIVGATEEHQSGYEKRNTAEGIRELLSQAIRLVPALAEAAIVRTWSGLRPGTLDRRPHLGRIPDYENLWAATGHFRSGLILAPITAEIMADLLLRGRTEWDISRYAPGRPQPAGDGAETPALDDTGN